MSLLTYNEKHYANFVTTGSSGLCRNDNIRWPLWLQKVDIMATLFLITTKTELATKLASWQLLVLGTTVQSSDDRVGIIITLGFQRILTFAFWFVFAIVILCVTGRSFSCIHPYLVDLLKVIDQIHRYPNALKHNKFRIVCIFLGIYCCYGVDAVSAMTMEWPLGCSCC